MFLSYTRALSKWTYTRGPSHERSVFWIYFWFKSTRLLRNWVKICGTETLNCVSCFYFSSYSFSVVSFWTQVFQVWKRLNPFACFTKDSNFRLNWNFFYSFPGGTEKRSRFEILNFFSGTVWERGWVEKAKILPSPKWRRKTSTFFDATYLKCRKLIFGFASFFFLFFIAAAIRTFFFIFCKRQEVYRKILRKH